MNLTGGAFEIAGFLFVSIDLYRLQRNEFGPLWFERALVACRRTISRMWRKLTRQTPTTHYGSASLGLSKSGGTAKATLRLATGAKSLEDRVAGLEANLGELDKEVEEQRLEVKQEIRHLQTKLERALTDLQGKQQQSEAEERARRRQSLKFQWAGIPLFLFGVIFSVAGNIISC